jgi:hypothetical protein
MRLNASLKAFALFLLLFLFGGLGIVGVACAEMVTLRSGRRPSWPCRASRCAAA